MVQPNDFDTGMAVYLDDELYIIQNYEHSKKARGGAFVRTTLRDAKSGELREETFKADTDFTQAIIEEKPAEYLYDSGRFHVFMNMESYDQVELSKELIGDQENYLSENMELELKYSDGDPIGIQLPDKVSLTVTDTSPGVKGDTAQGGSKPAETESGLSVDVPLFINEAEKIIVNTNTGEYVGRAD